MVTIVSQVDNGDHTHDVVLEHRGTKVRCECAGLYSKEDPDQGCGVFGLNLDDLDSDFTSMVIFASMGSDYFSFV